MRLTSSSGTRDRYGDAAYGGDETGRAEAGDGRVSSRDVALT
jgi:hypothetical protein